MKVVSTSKKSKFTPITVSITFESRQEVTQFNQGMTEVERYGDASELEEMLGQIQRELSK